MCHRRSVSKDSVEKMQDFIEAIETANAIIKFIRNKFRIIFWDSAGVAQLVEHHLAKVRVAGSSLVSRS